MTSRRLRMNRFYNEGRLYADGGTCKVPPEYDHTGREAFGAGYNDQKAEQAYNAELDRRLNGDLTELVNDAIATQSLDLMGQVLLRLIEKVEA